MKIAAHPGPLPVRGGEGALRRSKQLFGAGLAEGVGHSPGGVLAFSVLADLGADHCRAVLAGELVAFVLGGQPHLPRSQLVVAEMRSDSSACETAAITSRESLERATAQSVAPPACVIPILKSSSPVSRNNTKSSARARLSGSAAVRSCSNSRSSLAVARSRKSLKNLVRSELGVRATTGRGAACSGVDGACRRSQPTKARWRGQPTLGHEGSCACETEATRPPDARIEPRRSRLVRCRAW